MLVLTEKLLGFIPGVYPHSCEDSWLLEKNESGTQVRCTNDFCPITDSYKLKEALDLLEFRINVGDLTSLEIILALELETHMHIFKLACESISEGTRDAWDKYSLKLNLIQEQIAARNANGGFRLADYMDAWGCEQLGSTRAEKIFGRISNLNEFYNTYNDEISMCEFVGKKLNNSPYCSTVLNIVYFLRRNKHFILDIAKYFVFKQPVTVDTSSSIGDISVCITGEIQCLFDENGNQKVFKPRAKVISYWEERYGIPIDFHKSLTQKTRFLINDEGNRKGKVKKIKNEKGYSRCIITTSNVFEVMLEVLKGDVSNVYSAVLPDENKVQSW